MEQNLQDNVRELRRTMPKAESNVSVVMNGIGNGMMVGTAPFVAMELYSHLADKKLSNRAYALNAFALVAGSTLGGWFGLREAHRLHDYRQSLVDGIENVSKKVDEHCAQLDSWTDKLSRQADAAPDKSR